MLKTITASLFTILVVITSVASAQAPTPNGNTLGFGSAVPAGATPPGPPIPSSGTPLSFGSSVTPDPNYDPLTDTSNLSLGQPVPASGNNATGRSQGGGSPQGGATQEEIQQAIQGYVIPTSTRNFSLSNLNVSNEMNLEISNSNNQNNVIFRVMRLIAMLVGTVAILLYIVGGYFMIVSQGDDNALSKGKQIITFTSLGLVIVFGAYMLIQFAMGLIYFTS